MRRQPPEGPARILYRSARRSVWSRPRHRKRSPLPALFQRAALTILASATLLVTACAHQVRGVVRLGQNSYVQVVDADDPRLDQGDAVVGARVSSVVAPQSLNSTALVSVASDATGAFSIPVENFGAGWLEYELGVVCRKDRHAPAEGFFPMPGSGQRLLIVLKPGRDRLNTDSSAYGDEYSWQRDLESFGH